MPLALSGTLVPGTVTAEGYGDSSSAGGIGLLNQVNLTIEPCDYSTDHICAGAPNGTVAPGDSGGALIQNGALVGIVDEFYDYTGDLPSIFTPISEVEAWVQSQANLGPAIAIAISPHKKPKRHKHHGVSRGTG